MHAHWLDDSATALDADTLAAHGVVYEFLGTNPAEYQPKLDDYKSQRGYGTQDEVGLNPSLENLDEICAKFDKEHLHTDDEVRFVIDGEGIFDIRSSDDRWMRVVVEPGDLIIVPKDKHHRFRLTESKSIHCVRLFQDQSGWVPVYRAASD
ncbi:MAG: cupin domain-containing protein [Planctomycetota bacterium]|jgi:1,2-dihydroxy-3-keto-5-methylthiopentene dioxygenase|nr:cupin domain-containing protein [Planctomycetota bacterium]